MDIISSKCINNFLPWFIYVQCFEYLWGCEVDHVDAVFIDFPGLWGNKCFTNKSNIVFAWGASSVHLLCNTLLVSMNFLSNSGLYRGFPTKTISKIPLNLGYRSSGKNPRNTFCLIFRRQHHFHKSSVFKWNSSVTTMKM